MVGSLRRPDVAVYEPGVRSGPDGATVVTLDARDPDRWVRFDLDGGELVSGEGEWDLAVRRYEVRLRGAAGVRELGEWHRYDFFSHLLIPRERGYRVALGDGRSARLRFLSYYCPGPEAGCVTLRYRIETEDPAGG